MSINAIFLRQMRVLGKLGTLQNPDYWIHRFRHNPIYDFFKARRLMWLDDTNGVSAQLDTNGDSGAIRINGYQGDNSCR